MTALAAARALGVERQHSYENKFGQTVHWKLAQVVEIKELLTDALGHGTEVYYRFFSRPESDTSPFE